VRKYAWKEALVMRKKRFSAEQIVTLLRQIEVLMAQGKSAPEACRDAGISQQSLYRWCKEYGGLEIEQAKRMKDLERENRRAPPDRIERQRATPPLKCPP
jgi:putative transposase